MILRLAAWPASRKVSGAKPIFGWYYRMDPQIEQVCGRADVAMNSLPGSNGRTPRRGDYFGVHAHPLLVRRAPNSGYTISTTDSGCATARNSRSMRLPHATGSPTRLFRSGAGFMSNEIVDVADRNGVVAELSLEPVAGWGLRSKVVPGAVDTSPIVGDYTNCVTAPKTALSPQS